MIELKIEMMAVNKIKPFAQNAKKHNVEWIEKSIAEFKPDVPIVVDGSNTIIKGHGRWKAAKKFGMKEFPVIIRNDLTAAQCRLSRIADNRSGVNLKSAVQINVCSVITPGQENG